LPAVAVAEQPAGEDRALVLDELDEQLERFRVLRKSDPAATDTILDTLGAQTQVDRDIVLQLSATRPLGHPERFEQAHALAMRSLDVLARNGGRKVPVPNVGPLRPIVAYPIQQVCRFIVRSHQKRLIDSLRDLYDRRLGWTSRSDPTRMLLFKASMDVKRTRETFTRNPVPLPTFLLGGAAISALGSGGSALLDLAFGNAGGAVVAVVVVTLLFAALAGAIIRGAAVARRRIRLTVDRPMAALWETVGRAGKPPEDQARMFALWGVVLTAVSWVVVPAGIVFIVSRV
jgi:hypothetical protein